MPQDLQTETTVVAPRKLPRWKKRLGILAGLVLALALVFLFRVPLLRHAANWWIVNEPLTHADAIVVLGGGVETRTFEAARLYHEGWASRILVMNPVASPTTKLGLTLPESELAHKVLLKQDVPESAIIIPEKGVTSTWDESVVVRDWAKANGIKRIIITTDLFHTRRVRWLFHKQLKGMGVEVIVRAVDPLRYNSTNWWRHEEGLIAFQSEIIKFAYYWVEH